MVNIKILAGGFSGFIATYVFDSDAASLQLVKQNPSGTNPSWIAPHAQNKTVLYAVNENSPVGDVQSFTIDADGGLTLVDTITSQGNAPTFTNPLSTGEISAVNFGSPNTTVIATDPNDPAKFIEGPTVAFPRPEGASNPHMSLEVDGEILVPDLGADTIWRVISDGEAPGAFKVQGQIDVDKGSGPRHIAVRDGVLFILHEKTSTLTAQLLPQAPNGTSAGLLANVSIVPEQRPANTSFFAAEIFISEPTEQFPEPLIYVSNRNLGPDVDPAGDTIAIFRFNNPNGTVAPSTPTDAPAATETAGQTASPSPSPIGDEEDCDEEDPAPVAAPPPSNVHMMYSTKRMIKRRVHDSVISAMFYKRQEPETKPVLELVAQIPTGLQQIRSFAIGPVGAGQDEFLIAGANTEGGVAVFRRTDGGANLELVARNLDLGNRTSFVFL